MKFLWIFLFWASIFSSSTSFAKPPISSFDELLLFREGKFYFDSCNGKFRCGGTCGNLIQEGEAIQFQGTCQNQVISERRIDERTVEKSWECQCVGAWTPVDND